MNNFKLTLETNGIESSLKFETEFLLSVSEIIEILESQLHRGSLLLNVFYDAESNGICDE